MTHHSAHMVSIAKVDAELRRGPEHLSEGTLLQQVLSGQHVLIDRDVSTRPQRLHERDEVADT